MLGLSVDLPFRTVGGPSGDDNDLVRVASSPNSSSGLPPLCCWHCNKPFFTVEELQVLSTAVVVDFALHQTFSLFLGPHSVAPGREVQPKKEAAQVQQVRQSPALDVEVSSTPSQSSRPAPRKPFGSASLQVNCAQLSTLSSSIDQIILSLATRHQPTTAPTEPRLRTILTARERTRASRLRVRRLPQCASTTFTRPEELRPNRAAKNQVMKTRRMHLRLLRRPPRSHRRRRKM